MAWEKRSITQINIIDCFVFFRLRATNANPNNPHICNVLFENAPTAVVVGLFDKYLNISKYGKEEVQERVAANKLGLGSQVTSPDE